jgi:glycosyltransferase involved in cell wall biosynthesis
MERKLRTVFLFPQVYRPLNVDFARKFELLSSRASGYIFTFCSRRYKNLVIADFRLWSGIVVSTSTSRVLKGIWVQILYPIWLIWRQYHIDVVITYDPYADGFAGIILKLFLRTKLLVEINGDYHQQDPAKHAFKRWLMRRLYHICVRSADAIKVLNRDQENFINKRYPEKKIFRFPSLIATEFFRSLEHYQGDYLLSVGTEFERKGIDILIRAFNQISGKHPNIKLKIMGYCPENEIRKYLELASGNSKIEFIKAGWIEDVGEQMRGCYALVSAARSEAMGRVHFEAMACKKPIVTTRTNGGLDSIEDGRTGLLCDIGNVDDLAMKLDWLVSRPTVAAQMGQKAFERLQKEFSEEKYAEKFFEMIEEVVNCKNLNFTTDKPSASVNAN